MYLKKDITGQASGIEYGKVGDNVSVLENGKDWKCDMILVENKGVKFFVFADDLSETYDKRKEDNSVTEIIKKNSGRIQRVGTSKGRRK